MKKLEISRLMDEYTDTEVFPGGGSAADLDAVKAQVLASAKAPAQRTRMPRKKKVLLAAALAAVMLVLVGAGFPYIQHRLVGGTLSFEQTSSGRITALVHSSEVLKREGGRLYFIQNDGQRIDVTDLISEDTPYIYDNSDPDTGMIYYVILGGTPDYYGSFEWIITPNPFTYDDGHPNEGAEDGVMYTYSYDTYRESVTEYGEPYIHSSGRLGSGTVTWNEGEDNIPTWLLSAMEELGIPYEFIPTENIATIGG